MRLRVITLPRILHLTAWAVCVFAMGLGSTVAHAASQLLDGGVSTTGYIQSAGISATNISATRISGDGSGLTNVTGSTDRITSGTLAQVITQTAGTIQISATNTYVNYGGTNNASMSIGAGATGNRNTFIDLIADTTYPSYGLRIIRNAGANGGTNIAQRGTGTFNISAQDAAPIVFNTSNAEAMRITPAGYVGIGTSGPSYPLDVNGRIGAVSLTLNGTALGTAANNTTVLSTLYHSNGNGSYLQTMGIRDGAGTAWDTGGTRIQQYVDATYMGYIQFNGTGNSGGISFGTGLAASPQTVPVHMTINSGGSVGINTATPLSPLHVTGAGGAANGLARFTTSDYVDTSTGSGLLIRTGANSGNTYTSLAALSSGFTALNYLILQPTGGNVGIGTTAPNATLEVNGTVSSSVGVFSSLLSVSSTLTGSTAWSELNLISGRSVADEKYWTVSNDASTGLFSIRALNDARNAEISRPLNITRAGNVGIGTTTPKQFLHVVKTASAATTSAQFGTGTNSLFLSSPLISGNVYYDGSNWRYEGTGAGTAIGLSGSGFNFYTAPSGTAGNVATLSSLMTLDSSGNLNIIGNAGKPGGGAWAATSDARLKNVDATYTAGLAQIVALQPVRFHYKKGNARHEPTDKQYIGLVAQQAQKTMPETVSKGADGYLSLDSTPITFALINSVKELNTRNEQLTADVADLKAQLQEIRTELKHRKH